MLHDTVDENINGTLTIWDIHCTFSLSRGSILDIRPIEPEIETFQSKCQERNGNYNSLGWIHARSYQESDLAFMISEEQGPFSYYKGTLTLSVDIILQTCNVKGTDGKYLYDYEDLCGFNAIDFTGKAVAAIFSPKTAIVRHRIDEHKIEWLSCKEYAKEFETTVNGVPCKLIFTIVIDRRDLDLESTTLGTMHSVVRLAFSERQDISMIEPCWQAVCTFLTFCTGQYNVTNLEIGLWDKAKSPSILNYFGNITCKINCDKSDDILSTYPTYYRFPISSLGEKTGTLFWLLNDAKKHPILGFFPRTNTDLEVDRNKIRELCTAFEVEYKNREEELSDPWISALVEKLAETAKQFRKENPQKIDDTEYSYIHSSISVISRPAKKKLLCIYNRYKNIIDKNVYHFLSPHCLYTIDISDEATERDIGWIVRTRNNITHSTGNTDTVIPNAIFARLKTALLCSIIERAGYTIEDVEKIIDCYFSGSTPLD